jgi:uncharacterized protein
VDDLAHFWHTPAHTRDDFSAFLGAVDVAARRAERRRVVTAARRYATLLAPLLTASSDDLEQALTLYERHQSLGAFDALLAATAIRSDATALVSADRSFGMVRGLRWVDPSAAEGESLLG